MSADDLSDEAPPTIPPLLEMPPEVTPPTRVGETPAAPGAIAVPLYGIQVPGYEILSELGRGGMGVVYKARQVALGRVVALKMILSGEHACPAEMARFRTEAEAIARLQHPGIVAVHDVGESEGRPFLSLEFCPGGSLDRKLAGAPMQPRAAAALVQKLAEAMHAAHEAKVIHRDLKPANVLLAPLSTEGRGVGGEGEFVPKITDFGLAKKLDEQGKTHTGAVMGTPSYMAPEQALGRKDVGPAADVYSLGAILYECLIGRPPFRAATATETVIQVINEEPVPPRQLNPRTPRDLETIALKCLAKEPPRRYASAADLAGDLARFLAGKPIRACPIGPFGRAAKWVRRNPALAAMAALLVAALASGTAASTLFALDARAEAKVARLAEQTADEKAKEARQEKHEAELARAELETELVGSLLRQLGQSPLRETRDSRGRRTSGDEPPLDPHEAEALVKVGGIRRDSTRLRLLEVALDDCATAERTGRRAEWVIQAAVGMDADRRRKATALLVREQRAAVPERAMACTWLGIDLNVRDPHWSGRAAEDFVALLGKTTDEIELKKLVGGLQAVSEGLDAPQAARVAAALVVALSAATDHGTLGALADAFEVVSRRLDAEQAVETSVTLVAALGKPGQWTAPYGLRRGLKALGERLEGRAAADFLVATMSKTSDGETMSALADCLNVVCQRLGAEESAAAAGRGALVAATATDPKALASCLKALGERLDSKRASEAADCVVVAMNRTTDLDVLKRLLETLLTLGDRCDDSQAVGAAGVDALAGAMSRTAEARGVIELGQLLKPTADRLDAAHAAGPVGRVADAIVAAMSKASADDVLQLTRLLKMVSERLEADLMMPRANAAADLHVASLSKTEVPESLACLGAALGEISLRMSAEQATAAAGQAAGPLVAALGKTTVPRPVRDLGWGLGEVGKCLDPNHAAEVTDALLAALRKTTDPDATQSLAEAMSAAGGRLDPTRRREKLLQAVEILAAAVSRATQPYELTCLCWALGAVAERLEGAEADGAADAIIAAMSKTTIWEGLERQSKTLAEMGKRQAAHTVDAILVALLKATTPGLREYLTSALVVVGEHFDARQGLPAADALVAAMRGATDPAMLFCLARGLYSVTKCLDRAAASARAAEAIGVLVAAICRASDWDTLSKLKRKITELIERLDAAQAARVAASIVATMKRTPSAYLLSHLADKLEEVSGRLDAQAAASVGGEAVDVLLAGMNRLPASHEMGSLVSGVQTLVARLDGPRLSAAAEALIAVMRKTTDGETLERLAGGVEAVCVRLDATQAARLSASSADALLAALARKPSEPDKLTKSLKATAPRLGAEAAGRSAASLIGVLGATQGSRAADELVEALKATCERLDAVRAAEVADLVVAAMSRADVPRGHGRLAQVLKVACDRLDAEQAAPRSLRAADALVAVMSKKTDPSELAELSEGLKAVSARLDAGQAAPSAGAAADVLVTALKKGAEPYALAQLARGLRAVSEPLDDRSAASRATVAADLLATALSKTTERHAMDRLTYGLQAVSGRLGASEAARHARTSAGALLEAMSKAPNPDEQSSLADLLASVSERLDAGGMRDVAGRLITSASRTTGQSLRNLTWSIRAVTGRHGTAELIPLLADPLCAGPARAALLTVLGRRCKREFRNVWHFLDWAQSNGVDLAVMAREAGGEGQSSHR